jgi:electron transport complex protein RnfB
MNSVSNSLAQQIENVLPQTQCTKCGFAGCHPYAEAIANGSANYNQCPPGGAEGIEKIANLLKQAIIPLNTTHGIEKPRTLAFIEEEFCIGCTLCIQACPVDAIVGAAKHMHTIIPELCTGCDLCIPPCPVDCITIENVTENLTGWQAWTQAQADDARARHNKRDLRLIREKQENEARLLKKAHEKFAALNAQTNINPELQAEQERKKSIVAAAIARAKSKQSSEQSN